ncbi:2-amino-4-hydroxy-6-hydroxymethyldihydropteridine diphosphokinase [Chondromyces apiculatus]|uniref:2-amino-4-hydroxy-6-hydroxymethyldihydropteridine pyrophosphokinase n=1 Tax=Chondromyces apiculatus DSM 436 TaxID=1192034 RepID=A0A017TCD3_9BACT|nr:2-amino-4-hydroxy-6-hydroxymethyldihydropteridine diphosphokinase [Chondromyces apiculatus]EYF06470.1 2-amino-4-hydroxy-6-hydroxymethyldihydropteridine pyrophosphokinase [Chondromyces apiculatus DSM 436]
MERARRIVLGLGSNLGDRAATLRAAIAALRADPDLHLLAEAARYETPPAGGPPQPRYLNTALLLTTALSPPEILARTLAIEHAHGRVRPDPIRWGPRTLDIDLLWIEGETHDTPSLTVPHPRLRERPFALRPLLDVAPDARDPHTGAPYADLPAARAAIERVP